MVTADYAAALFEELREMRGKLQLFGCVSL